MTYPNEITIADVAKAAGVSVSTVSRILNNKLDVASATRERVQRIIEEMGYSPHAQAQRLRAGKTRSIALLFSLKHPGNRPYNPLEMDFIIGGAAAAGEQEFFFSLLTNPVSRHSLVDLYRSAQIDGLVLMQVHTQDWRVDLLREYDYPFVMIGHCNENTGLSFIDLDFAVGVEMAIEYLVEQGHHNIGFLGHPEVMRLNGYGPAVRSWEGYQRAVHNHNIVSTYQEASFVGQNLFNSTLTMLDDLPQMTAIVTVHANAALNIIRALNERGLRVPEDCSVIALTSQQIAELSTPALTTIDFPSYDMGYQAVAMLIRKLQGESGEPEQILIPPRLELRDSTPPISARSE